MCKKIFIPLLIGVVACKGGADKDAGADGTSDTDAPTSELTDTDTTTTNTDSQCVAPELVLASEAGGQLLSADLDGTNLALITGNLSDPKGVDIDPQACWIYYTAEVDGAIGRVRPDGTENVTLISGLNAPSALELDLVDGGIYWADNNGSVNRANLDGTGVEVLVEPMGNSSGIALDRVEGRIYWGDWLGQRIRSVSQDGSDVQEVLADVGVIEELDIDFDTGCVLYWAVESPPSIRSASCDGSNAQILLDEADGLIAPEGLAIDRVNGKIYYSDEGVDSIMMADLDGGMLQAVIDTTLNGPSGLAILD